MSSLQTWLVRLWESGWRVSSGVAWLGTAWVLWAVLQTVWLRLSEPPGTDVSGADNFSFWQLLWQRLVLAIVVATSGHGLVCVTGGFGFAQV